jgi:hypothetical protein
VKTHLNQRKRLAITLALLAASVSGCACHEVCEPCNFQGYAAWPCYGYHSTCWRPWPAECVPCPSPFMPVELPAGEAVPVPDPGVPPMPLPMPVEPAPALPAVPFGEPAPGEQPAVENPQGASSRRRAAESQVFHLESLRWAPTDSR